MNVSVAVGYSRLGSCAVVLTSSDVEPLFTVKGPVPSVISTFTSNAVFFRLSSSPAVFVVM